MSRRRHVWAGTSPPRFDGSVTAGRRGAWGGEYGHTNRELRLRDNQDNLIALDRQANCVHRPVRRVKVVNGKRLSIRPSRLRVEALSVQTKLPVAIPEEI